MQALLRILAHYTKNEQEKRRILELCSLQGSDDYTRYLRQPNVNIFDLLEAFPSCRPPIERLLEHWPRLLPRPYSISSSPLTVCELKWMHITC
jgi:methionine synthase reductase